MARKYAQLSIDVTPELLEAGGIVEVTARSKRFIEKVFRARRRRHFQAPWMPDGVLNAEGGGDRTIDLRVFLAPETVSVGDRVVLVASVDADPGLRGQDEGVEGGFATLYDGGALFVLHVLERADPLTRDRLAGLHPPRDVAEVVDSEERQQWSKLRDEIVNILIEQEIRGPASIQALSEHLAGEDIDLALLNDADEPVSATDVLSDVFDARRGAKRGRRRSPAAAGLFDPIALFRRYEPSTDGRTLLRVLERSRETFGHATAAPDPDTVTVLLREVSRGIRPPGRRLPR